MVFLFCFKYFILYVLIYIHKKNYFMNKIKIGSIKIEMKTYKYVFIYLSKAWWAQVILGPGLSLYTNPNANPIMVTYRVLIFRPGFRPTSFRPTFASVSHFRPPAVTSNVHIQLSIFFKRRSNPNGIKI